MKISNHRFGVLIGSPQKKKKKKSFSRRESWSLSGTKRSHMGKVLELVTNIAFFILLPKPEDDRKKL